MQFLYEDEKGRRNLKWLHVDRRTADNFLEKYGVMDMDGIYEAQCKV